MVKKLNNFVQMSLLLLILVGCGQSPPEGKKSNFQSNFECSNETVLESKLPKKFFGVWKTKKRNLNPKFSLNIEVDYVLLSSNGDIELIGPSRHIYITEYSIDSVEEYKFASQAILSVYIGGDHYRAYPIVIYDDEKGDILQMLVYDEKGNQITVEYDRIPSRTQEGEEKKL